MEQKVSKRPNSLLRDALEVTLSEFKADPIFFDLDDIPVTTTDGGVATLSSKQVLFEIERAVKTMTEFLWTDDDAYLYLMLRADNMGVLKDLRLLQFLISQTTPYHHERLMIAWEKGTDAIDLTDAESLKAELVEAITFLVDRLGKQLDKYNG